MRVVVTALANRQFDELPTHIDELPTHIKDRVQFQVEGDHIVVTRVGHRDGFYDD